MRRGVLVTLAGIVVGAALGLGYAWVIAPVRYSDTTPATLRSDFKDAFREAISAAYATTGNLDRARARLNLLGDPDPAMALAEQAQHLLAAGGSFEAAQQLALLGSDLQAGKSSLGSTQMASAPLTVTPQGPTATPTNPTSIASAEVSPVSPATSTAAGAFLTPTPRPTRTPAPTASAPFALESQEPACNPDLPEGLMQILVLDDQGRQLAGIEIGVTWTSGQESFYTGLKPEIGNGYADFVMQPDETYAVSIARLGTSADRVAAPTCKDSSGSPYLGSLKLTFQQP